MTTLCEIHSNSVMQATPVRPGMRAWTEHFWLEPTPLLAIDEPTRRACGCNGLIRLATAPMFGGLLSPSVDSAIVSFVVTTSDWNE